MHYPIILSLRWWQSECLPEYKNLQRTIMLTHTWCVTPPPPPHTHTHIYFVDSYVVFFTLQFLLIFLRILCESLEWLKSISMGILSLISSTIFYIQTLLELYWTVNMTIMFNKLSHIAIITMTKDNDNDNGNDSGNKKNYFGIKVYSA